jgi:hypothetical protein
MEKAPGGAAIAFRSCSTLGRICHSIHGLSAHGSNRNEIHGLVMGSRVVFIGDFRQEGFLRVQPNA